MDGSRPAVDDDDTKSIDHNFNRIKLSSDRKNEICSQIADSTESLPFWNAHNRSDSSASGPNNVADSSDVATPMPKANPMESAVATAGAVENPVGDLGPPLKGAKSADLRLSAVSTQVDTETDDGKARGAKKGDRPGTLRRLTTKIRRSISHNP